MSIELESLEAQRATTSLLRAIGQLTSLISTIRSARTEEFNTRLVARRADQPQESELESLQFVDGSMETTYDVAARTELEQVSVKLRLATDSIVALLS